MMQCYCATGFGVLLSTALGGALLDPTPALPELRALGAHGAPWRARKVSQVTGAPRSGYRAHKWRLQSPTSRPYTCASGGSFGGEFREASSNSSHGRRAGNWQDCSRTRRVGAGSSHSQEQEESSVSTAAGGGGGAGDDGGGGGGSYGGGGDGSEGPGDGRSRPLPAAGLWSRYTELLDRHPLLVKSLTAGLLNAIADFVCQVVVERESTVDLRRLLSFVAIGVFMSGPGLHFWYGALSKVISVPGMGGVVLRTAADQLVFTPLGVVGFFVALLTLEGRQTEIAEKLQKDVFETVVANWKVWIPFQFVNFGFVPPQFQVAAAGILGMVWSIFISHKGHT